MDRDEFFLRFPKLMRKLKFNEHGEKVQSTVGHASVLTSKVGSSLMKATFRECPLVWDIGSLFGLTPFKGNFIDYIECQIPVKDISHTNMVIDMNTILHKFEVNGKPIWMPCLSYHLPSADICLFSPHTYHTLYNGHSIVLAHHVEMFVGEHCILISIDQEGGNVPTIFNTALSQKEICKYRTSRLFCSSLY